MSRIKDPSFRFVHLSSGPVEGDPAMGEEHGGAVALPTEVKGGGFPQTENSAQGFSSFEVIFSSILD